MTARSLIDRIVQQEDINFFLTNRIPRRRLTQFMGWLSRIEQPWLCAAGIFLWRLFTDLDLGEAKETRFKSLHACFTRQLKDGAAPSTAIRHISTSPCDALVGACGRVAEGTVLQAKGFPYRLAELLCDEELARYYRGGEFATLRLTSSMYHRFHAPYDCRVEQVDYISGDTWNVNPIALKRIERLLLQERARGHPLPPALGRAPHPGAGGGDPGREHPAQVSRRAPALEVSRARTASLATRALSKGEEMGWFEHGSTIIVLAPQGFELCERWREGGRIRMGEALLAGAAAGYAAQP